MLVLAPPRLWILVHRDARPPRVRATGCVRVRLHQPRAYMCPRSRPSRRRLAQSHRLRAHGRHDTPASSLRARLLIDTTLPHRSLTEPANLPPAPPADCRPPPPPGVRQDARCPRLLPPGDAKMRARSASRHVCRLPLPRFLSPGACPDACRCAVYIPPPSGATSTAVPTPPLEDKDNDRHLGVLGCVLPNKDIGDIGLRACSLLGARRSRSWI
ncbi:hypothetical protein C8R45DRAFT_412506 [Mycena sanguinolenta]|nr:hypothetical protein C8R45DRAFT_412506 [Mycena sanguinolenta]